MRGAKLLLAVLFFVLISNSAYAELSLQGPSNNIFNLGDEIDVSGYLIQNNSMIVLLKLMLSCSGSENTLFVKTISLTGGVKKDFSENLPIPIYDEGDCTVKAKVEKSGNLLEEVESKGFKVTKALGGSFNLDKQSLVLGDTLKLIGNVYKIDGSNIFGTAIIRFLQNGIEQFVDSSNIDDGSFYYEFNSKENPSGNYEIKIDVTDIYGNYQVFDAGTFAISSNITLSSQLSAINAKPGDEVKIYGYATISGNKIEKGKARITFLGKEDTIDFTSGEFTYSLEIPKDIKTGVAYISLFVDDEFGNTGSQEVSVLVEPSLKRMEIKIEKEVFMPNELISITPVIYDQAGDVVAEKIKIFVADPKGSRLIEELVDSNTAFEFTLLTTAMPGKWEIIASVGGLKETIRFHVREKIELKYEIINGTLLVTNLGNSDYEGPIEIELKSGENSVKIVKEIDVGVNETISIDLAGLSREGANQVVVDGNAFDDVNIIGEKKDYWGIIKNILAVVIPLIIVIYLIVYIKVFRKRKIRREIERAKIIYENRKLREKYGRKKDDMESYHQKINMEFEERRKPLKFKFGRKSEDMHMFEMPRKKDKKTESSYTEYSGYPEDTYDTYSGSRQSKDSGDKKEGGGLFNMFE